MLKTDSPSSESSQEPTPNVMQQLLSRSSLICIFTGFSSGLPLYFLLQLLPAWLHTEGIGLKEIGAFALIQLPYTWKFLWSPLLDNYSLPLGRRRGWIFLAQIVLLVTMAALGQLDPRADMGLVVVLAVAVAFFSATQDIVLDAYRRELLSEAELGLGNSIHVNAYRVASFVPGALALILSAYLPWAQVFLITALFMLPGMVLVLCIKEPLSSVPTARSLSDAVIKPFHEFFTRKGIKNAVLILLFLVLYKLGDSLATALATPFYLAMKFSMTEIGLVAKNAGFWPALIGGISGGILMLRIGINKALWLFGIVQVVSILGFALLAVVGHNLLILALVIGFEALGVGLGTAAFTAFIARTTHVAYTATQLALFTSIAALPRTLINSSAGIMVEHLGWFYFFCLCFILALPGMLLLIWVAPWHEPEAHT